jgi:cytochrome c551/c552
MEEKEPNLLFRVRDDFREIRLPAVWLPHGVLGISNSEILKDETQGAFGPFAGQLFVGDQGQSKIIRVDLEKVQGEYQGVAFDFRSGFQSGVLRLTWGSDGSLFVGETNRGWGSAGTTHSGLERLVWAGKVPMEMKTVKAMPDGFEITFTREVNRITAEDLDSYSGRSFTYKYHPVYGSPTINEEPLNLKGVKVSEDGLKARLVVGNLRQYYIHHLEVPGIRSKDGNLPVLHASAYYTLNNLPKGDQLSFSELSIKRSLAMRRVPERPNSQANSNHHRQVPSYGEVKPLLYKNTCLACHQTSKRQVGPAFSEIAKRRYSNEKIVELIYSPQSQNWPDYAAKMAPMPQVPREEAVKIASWINSLREEH